MTPQDTKNENHMYVHALLHCGSDIKLIQREPGMVIELELTPPKGKQLNEMVIVKDNKLVVNITVESFLGFYQLLQMIAGTGRKRKRKKFLGLL